MAVSDENQLYREYCQKKNYALEPSVKKALSNASATGEFDLSGHPIGPETCEALAYVLTKSANLISLNFTDCLLNPDGLTHILEALQNNKYIRELNLYGNNITSPISVKLGKLLGVNSAIKTLILKWNSMGLSVDSFAVFCGGLQENKALENIDLRNNQLCPQSAKYLAHAFRKNNVLKNIDLRWNSIQNEGAEEILQSIADNKSIETIQLRGNFIHREILVAIEECLKNHSSVIKLNADHEVKTEILVNHIKVLEDSKTKQLNKITESANKHLKEAERRLAEVIEDNHHKQSKLDYYEEKLFEVRRNYKSEKQRADTLEEALKERETTYKELSNNHLLTIEKLQKSLQDKEVEQLKQFSYSQEQLSNDKEIICRLEKELNIERQLLANLKAEMAQMKNHYENKLKHCEDTIQMEKEMWQRKYAELENQTEAQIQRCRIMTLDKQQSLEKTIMELTERQSNKMMLANDKIERLKQEKALIEEQLNNAQSAVAQIQRENSSLIAQVAEPARKLTSLLEELSSERISNQQLKQEKLDERRSKEELQLLLDRTRGELSSLKNAYLNVEVKYEDEIKELKLCVKQLQSKLDDKDKKISNIRHEERARAKLLHSAFSKYWDRYTPSSGDS